MLQEKMLKPLEFEFQGKASEYFRIWIVNVLLTILTLGIYSAWAKVRTKQYFYGNTILDGSPFEYTASPVAILKGRLVVAAILILYAVCTSFYPSSEFAFYILFILVLPWLVMRSLMFNARYSTYRNLHFAFKDNLKSSYKVFLGVFILMVLTLGLLYPYYKFCIQRYRINNHSFGQYAFRLQKVTKDFYKIYFLGSLIFIAGMVVIIIIFASTFASIGQLVGADPETTALPPTEAAALLVMGVLYVLIYFFAFAFIQAKTFNTVWNNTALNKTTGSATKIPLVDFRGALSAGQLMFIYITNTIAIILSVGLLIPWAKIRLAQYRIDHLAVSSITDLRAIAAVEREKVGTIGSEMGDILDIDVGL